MNLLPTNIRRVTAETKPRGGAALRVPDMTHILIVHDHDADTERLKGVFRTAGFTSESVNNMTEGCESARSGRFHVVFSAPALGDGSWRRLMEVANQTYLPFEVILLARTFDLGQWADALQRGAFDVLDVLWDLPKAGEAAKHASAMTYLKRGRPHPDAVELSEAAPGADRLEDQMVSKLFVGNLAHSTTESGLSDFVTNAGFQVASAVVIRDKMTGSPRGFGFVELAEGQDMAGAIAGLNGQALEGRPLTVNEARPPRTGFGPNRNGGDRDRFSRQRDN